MKEPGIPRLNLGCHQHAEKGWWNVDLEAYLGVDQTVDLNGSWPWPDASVAHIKAWDLIEHLDTPGDPWHFWNEAWRVLKPGGVLEIGIPTTDGRGAFQDRTHVSFYNENSLAYVSAFHPLYHNLYPKLIRCAFDVKAKTAKVSPSGLVAAEKPYDPSETYYLVATLKKVPMPDVKPAVRDDVPGSDGEAPS